MDKYLGYGEEFDLPIQTQRYGTMPSPKWLEKKYHRKWQGYDSANTSIGQGYVLINPLQLAVMPARLAAGQLIQPRLLMAKARKPVANLDVDPAHLDIIRKAMTSRVNDAGTSTGATPRGPAGTSCGGIRSIRDFACISGTGAFRSRPLPKKCCGS